MAKNPRNLQIIVKGTSRKVKLDKHLRSYIRAYLDETQKVYLQRSSRTTEKPAMLAIRGVDYHAHQAQGLVTVHGYLRRYFMDEAGKLPDSCTREELIPHLAAAIHTAAVRLGRGHTGSEVASKFVFAISPEMSKAWKEAGVDVDAGLRYVVEQTFERYRLGVMDGAELGYAVGIHHDKEHLHAHVLLLHHAENGKHLKLSNRHQVNMPDGKIRRIDHLTLLTNTANVVLREYQQTLTTPAVSIGERNDHGPDIQRWLTLAACDRMPAGVKGDAAEAWRIKERERLRRAPAGEIVGAIDHAYHARLTLFRQCQNAATTSDGRDKLAASELRYREFIAAATAAAREVFALQRKARKEKLGLLKARLAELKILHKLVRITRTRLTPTSLTVIREIQQELADACLSDPTIGRLVEERLRIAGKLVSGGKLDKPARLAEVLNRKNLGHWRESLERQYADEKGGVDKTIQDEDAKAESCATYVESLKANIEIIKCAREMRTPRLLERYKKLRGREAVPLESYFGPVLDPAGQVQTKPQGISLRL